MCKQFALAGWVVMRIGSEDITFDTPLLQVDYFPEMDMRCAMVANCLSVVGVEAGNPRTLPMLEQLLGPPRGGWMLHKPFGQGGVSTCSMVALGLLRRLGVASPQVMGPYQIGTGLRVARSFARSLVPSAWITPSGGMRPKPGDVIELYPHSASRDLSNHSEVVVGWEGDTIVCVAGGQEGRGGLQAIHTVRRSWIAYDALAPTSGGRSVDGWIDVDLLPIVGPVVVPIGWDGLGPMDTLVF